MRTYKFRAWDKLGEGICPVEELSAKEVAIGVFDEEYGHLEKRKIEDVEVMQFTGLKDKDEREIFEGDIVVIPDESIVPVTDEGQGPIESCNHIVIIEFRVGEFGFEIPKTDDGETGWFSLARWLDDVWDEPLEVIGNIYENSDLLK